MNKKAISMAIATSLLVTSPFAIQKNVNANVSVGDKNEVQKQAPLSASNVLSKPVDNLNNIKTCDELNKKLEAQIKMMEALLNKSNATTTNDINKQIETTVKDVTNQTANIMKNNQSANVNANNVNQNNKNTTTNTINDAKNEVKPENGVLNLTLDKSMDIAVKNNATLKSLAVDVESAGLTLDKAEYSTRKAKNGSRDLDKGRNKLNQLQANQGQLQDAYNKIKAVEQATGKTASELAQGNTEIAKGLAGLNSAGINPDANVDFSTQFNGALSKGKEMLSEGESKLDNGVEDANSVIAQKLNIDVNRVLTLDSITDLSTTMAELQNQVTNDGYKIAEKQIALLTRQKYYEVIKCKKIENLKKLALDRATRQYQMAKDAFDHGMKAKDDMLLGQVQMKQMNVLYRNAMKDTKNAETEFKKVINIDLKTQINLVEDFATKPTNYNLDEGIKQGLEKRIEIRKSQAQYLVDKLNFELTSKQYPDITYQYKEAKIRMDKSKVEYDNKGSEVEASIRESYENVMATQDMLSYLDNVIANAKESLDIAEYRYKEGYGFETTVLKSANLEDVAGTIVEVMTAQERLTEIEEKVVEVIFNYNLAKDKYLNDIGTY